ncbi:hypothetical protein HMN09_01404100 [Mycena chlorophos]|uniref:Uncharacterized protein n=1 Tax=Mycena chlorophos TaxID=658473 RepID=A0A8H6VP02_MYCCL|nr:hypothetical protein HMN09_01404100 [Mycena chlorophos]
MRAADNRRLLAFPASSPGAAVCRAKRTISTVSTKPGRGETHAIGGGRAASLPFHQRRLRSVPYTTYLGALMEPKNAFESTPQAEDGKQRGIAPLASVPSSGGHVPGQDVSISPAASPFTSCRRLMKASSMSQVCGHSFGYAPAMNPTVVEHAAASFVARLGGGAVPVVGSLSPAVAGCSASRS